MDILIDIFKKEYLLMKKKVTALLLAVSMLTFSSQAVFANEVSGESTEQSQTEISPRYIAITRISPTLSKSGRISCTIQTTGYDYSLTVDLQQYISGNWEDIESWEEDGYRSGTFTTTSSLESGEKYRVHVYVTVYDSDGNVIETASQNSSTVTA